MSNIHFVLQGKGGVGKSLISALLMQYQLECKLKTIAIDTDPVNASLAAYTAFPTTRIELLDENQSLQIERFDDLMEMIFDKKDSDFIIDNGASSFIPLSSYIVENDVMDILSEAGHRPIVHTVVTGGQAMMDTLHGLQALGSNMNVPIVVWVNNYFGNVIYDGKTFEQMKAYENNKDKIISIIHIDKMPPLFESDFEKMLESHFTFAQALKDNQFGIMSKNRIRKIKTMIFDQLKNTTLSLKMLDDNDVE